MIQMHETTKYSLASFYHSNVSNCFNDLNWHIEVKFNFSKRDKTP